MINGGGGAGYRKLAVFDVAGGRTTDGTAVQLWDCLNNSAQQWRAEANGALVNPNSGKCLDIAGWGTANGTPMILWTCGNPVQSNQAWRRLDLETRPENAVPPRNRGGTGLLARQSKETLTFIRFSAPRMPW